MAIEKATFAAGCFWHVEDVFRHTTGVTATRVGYTGGTTPEPTHEEVCTDRTGHAEAVEITYASEVVSYEDLLAVFWSSHDPTQMNGQGPDIGTQYRSAIFVHDERQLTVALASKERLEKQARLPGPIVTQIVAASRFYPAEDYHQQYYEKQGISYCRL